MTSDDRQTGHLWKVSSWGSQVIHFRSAKKDYTNWQRVIITDALWQKDARGCIDTSVSDTLPPGVIRDEISELQKKKERKGKGGGAESVELLEHRKLWAESSWSLSNPFQTSHTLRGKSYFLKSQTATTLWSTRSAVIKSHTKGLRSLQREFFY